MRIWWLYGVHIDCAFRPDLIVLPQEGPPCEGGLFHFRSPFSQPFEAELDAGFRVGGSVCLHRSSVRVTPEIREFGPSHKPRFIQCSGKNAVMVSRCSAHRGTNVDKVYEAAVNRVEQLYVELKTLNDFIEMYRRTRHILGMDSIEHKAILMSDSEVQDAPEVASSRIDATSESPRKRVVDNPKPADVVSEAVMVLMEKEHPMSRRELHEALKARGMEVRGTDPVKTLGTMLWRSGQDSLVQLEGRGYWIKSEPYAPADYDPGPIAKVVDEAIKDVERGLDLV